MAGSNEAFSRWVGYKCAAEWLFDNADPEFMSTISDLIFGPPESERFKFTTREAKIEFIIKCMEESEARCS